MVGYSLFSEETLFRIMLGTKILTFLKNLKNPGDAKLNCEKY
jgi:hypothetical protein